MAQSSARLPYKYHTSATQVPHNLIIVAMLVLSMANHIESQISRKTAGKHSTAEENTSLNSILASPPFPTLGVTSRPRRLINHVRDHKRWGWQALGFEMYLAWKVCTTAEDFRNGRGICHWKYYYHLPRCKIQNY